MIVALVVIGCAGMVWAFLTAVWAEVEDKEMLGFAGGLFVGSCAFWLTALGGIIVQSFPPVNK